ncbi:MAG: DUF11 domain-containing protein [Methanobacteriaceae archaeon]|nr:DUF11 domain-containing protein [Methanobacteriaceae archaeon]
MKRFALILALVMLVSLMGVGVVTAQEDDDQVEGEADLAIDYTVTDIEGNPKTEVSVGDEVVETIAVENLGPDDATGVWVEPWIENGHCVIDSWAVSWDGGETWNEEDPSFYWTDLDYPVWDIGDLPVGETYLLVLYSTIDSIYEGSSEIYMGATIYGDQYDPDESNNEDYAVLKVTAQEPVREPVKAGEVPMQPTGAPLALAILSVLMTIAGLIVPKIR